MRLVLYTHPAFLGSHSQAHFARMLTEAYRARGHSVELRQPEPVLQARVPRGTGSKWAGYVDQYLLFPQRIRADLRRDPPHTLYVFCDQALGPWMPLVAHRPHVVHCHDLLALRSALGDIAENPTSFTGRVYQRYIRRGFQHARHFISISQKSRADLHRYGEVLPVTSEVVYNGLNHPYVPQEEAVALQTLSNAGLPASEAGYLLHVGGGQWYKNSVGVVRLYGVHAAEEVAAGRCPLPLWMVSPPPDARLQAAIAMLPPQAEVRFFSGLSTQVLEALYSHARVMLFPSLAEGFGWPIVEAQACGCPVITTDEAPMTEVGGDACTYLPRLRSTDDLAVAAWALHGAGVLRSVLGRSLQKRERVRAAGLAHAARFSAEAAIEAYLAVYQHVLSLESLRQPSPQEESHDRITMSP
ncbi:glycosyltransferase family 1 protein [Piscinibacter sp. HJYY11]|uniref:glycosyltransferase family 4 protein n=1 Tax=Piscinibacter sp. HJYY11 TaxID=2801333 RepID=UPI00191F0471|nr:glycosyltransferase family 1 protein [Piscinibacter sp. HJYY11]MBL0726217.1 glycosyltransferase family 4 protein [Piscinibacter sp. HJYY11]